MYDYSSSFYLLFSILTLPLNRLLPHLGRLPPAFQKATPSPIGYHPLSNSLLVPVKNITQSLLAPTTIQGTPSSNGPSPSNVPLSKKRSTPYLFFNTSYPLITSPFLLMIAIDIIQHDLSSPC